MTKAYDIEKEHYLTGGIHNLWKVYRARKKQATGGENKEVSIFMFDKKTIKAPKTAAG